jgi:hypothetical protein
LTKTKIALAVLSSLLIVMVLLVIFLYTRPTKLQIDNNNVDLRVPNFVWMDNDYGG